MIQKRLSTHHSLFYFLLPVFFSFFVLTSAHIFAENLDVIENPKPTHTAKKFLKLEPFKDISDIDKNHFLARPFSLAVDDEKSIYIYDKLLKKIIKLDHEHRWERSFGRQGMGPGEFTGNDSGGKKIYFSQDGHLYVNAPFAKKLIVFDKKGKVVKERRLPYALSNREFFPVADKQGNVYAFSKNNGAIDFYNKNFNLECTLLSKKDYQRFLFYPVINPHPEFDFGPTTPDMANTYYHILPGGELVIFITFSSRAYVFKDNKLINQFDFWPKKGLDYYQDLNAKMIKKRRNGAAGFSNLIYQLIPDMDDPGHFYLLSYPGANLYKVNLKGELVQALDVVGGNFRIEAKRHGLFYGFNARNEYVRIFKIKKEKQK